MKLETSSETSTHPKPPKTRFETPPRDYVKPKKKKNESPIQNEIKGEIMGQVVSLVLSLTFSLVVVVLMLDYFLL